MAKQIIIRFAIILKDNKMDNLYKIIKMLKVEIKAIGINKIKGILVNINGSSKWMYIIKPIMEIDIKNITFKFSFIKLLLSI